MKAQNTENKWSLVKMFYGARDSARVSLTLFRNKNHEESMITDSHGFLRYSTDAIIADRIFEERKAKWEEDGFQTI